MHNVYLISKWEKYRLSSFEMLMINPNVNARKKKKRPTQVP